MINRSLLLSVRSTANVLFIFQANDFNILIKLIIVFHRTYQRFHRIWSVLSSLYMNILIDFLPV